METLTKRMDTESLLSGLTINILLLEGCQKDWTGVIKELKGEAKATDEKEYACLGQGWI